MDLPQPDGPFQWVHVGGADALVCQPLECLARHLFTTRRWGMGPGAPAGEDAWTAVAQAMGVAPRRIVRARQVHGATVVVRRRGSLPAEELPEGDIIVSDDPDLALAIQTADCVALLLFDRLRGAVAAAHAGWRGLAAGVPRAAVAALAHEFGSRPIDLAAAAGPAIGPCCYEVGDEVRERLEQAGFGHRQLARWFHPGPRPAAANRAMSGAGAHRRREHWFLDIWTATHDQLEAAGVPPDRIFISRLCTACHPDLLCSYRRDGTGCGRMVGAIRARAGENEG